MDVVANNFILRRLKDISYFKMDLGFNLKGPVNMKPGGEEPKIKIRDEFIKKYANINDRFIFKYGEIGTLKFYEDSKINMKEIHVYHDDKIFEIEVSEDDLKKPFSDYLTEILQSIEGGGEESETIVKDIVYTNMPEELERPSMSLPKDEYIRRMVERRNLLSKIND